MIAKLADKWREDAKNCFPPIGLVKLLAVELKATELEDALPVWTTNTGESTPPEIGQQVWCDCCEEFSQICVFEGTTNYSDGDVHIFKTLYDEYISVLNWRPLCDLDYPPSDGEMK